jgi:uncharacterized protein
VILRTVLLSAALPWLAAPVLEKPAKYVTDRAGVLPEARRAALNEELAAFERATSNQIVVYVDRRLPAGTTLEELANVTFRSWGIGQKAKGNGVLFLVFAEDRAMRVEVGYGLEGAIPDARAKQITSDVVKPLFKKGDYGGGVEAGARALMAAARGEGHTGTGKTVAESTPSLSPLWALTPVAFGALTLAGSAVQRLRKGRSPLAALRHGALGGMLVSIVCAIVNGHPFFWGLAIFAVMVGLTLFVVEKVAENLTSPAARARRRAGGTAGGYVPDASSPSSWSDSSSSSGSSSSNDSSSSSSDFSGGGGDSGGGGSSDSW